MVTAQQILRVKEIIFEHKHRVSVYMTRIITCLTERSVNHDMTKFESEELEPYAEAVDGFAKNAFGSPGYEELKRKLGPAVEHHYQLNRHHPEFFENGINDMDLVDMVEMLCDWKSATQNHVPHGNLEKSIQNAIDKYGMSPQLAQILRNTAKNFGLYE